MLNTFVHNNQALPRRSRYVILSLLLGCLISSAVVAAEESATSGFIIVPFPIYSPETEAAITLTAVYHYRDAQKPDTVPPSMLMVSLAYSQLDQASVSMKTENYMDQGRWLLSSVLAYEDWPNKFWGIGNDSVEAKLLKRTTARAMPPLASAWNTVSAAIGGPGRFTTTLTTISPRPSRADCWKRESYRGPMTGKFRAWE